MRERRERTCRTNERLTRLLLESNELQKETRRLVTWTRRLVVESRSIKASNEPLDEQGSRIVIAIAQQGCAITAVGLATRLKLSTRTLERLLKELEAGNYVRSKFNRGAAFTYSIGDEGWNHFLENTLRPQLKRERLDN